MSREYGFGTGCFDDIEEAREFAAVVAARDGIGFIYTIQVNGRPLFSVTYSLPGQVRADLVERVISKPRSLEGHLMKIIIVENTTWTIPLEWTGNLNEIEVIIGGGDGSVGSGQGGGTRRAIFDDGVVVIGPES